MVASEILRIPILRASQAGRIGDHRQHFRSQYGMRRVGQVCRIHAAGVGNDYALERTQPLVQDSFFVFELLLLAVLVHLRSTLPALPATTVQRSRMIEGEAFDEEA